RSHRIDLKRINMEAVSKAKFQRYGRRKVGQVLDQIRGKTVMKAEHAMSAIPRRCATLVLKTIDSASANLSVKLGKKLDPNGVWISTAYVDQGPMKQLKRFQPGPQGRAMPYKRKMCHLTVIVSDTKGAV
ncbi:MAG: uL22 family ribosomal protein, partial [Elusimicrobia bacterium]|nr:uL22 family ribosomal protein [Elusimicrobiota bacterium]